jgi:hypothetical protein
MKSRRFMKIPPVSMPASAQKDITSRHDSLGRWTRMTRRETPINYPALECPFRVKLGGKGRFSIRPVMANDRTLPVLTASSEMCPNPDIPDLGLSLKIGGSARKPGPRRVRSRPAVAQGAGPMMHNGRRLTTLPPGNVLKVMPASPHCRCHVRIACKAAEQICRQRAGFAS